MRRKNTNQGHQNFPKENSGGRGDLFHRIMLRIDGEQRRRTRVRIIGFGVLSLVGGVALILSVNEFYTEYSRSSFAQFFSLIFSDTAMLAAYWQEFAYSLAESFPVLAASAVLMSIFGVLISLRFLTRDVRLSRSKFSTVV